jgi:RNA polymerase sigma factor (sigma-70 family)
VTHDRQMLESALLTVRWQRGDKAAFDGIVKLWERSLYYYLRRLAPTEADAWELLQETWLKTIRSLQKLRDPQALPAFLYATARNLALSRLRGRGFQTAAEDQGEAATEGGETGAFDDAEQVHHALDQLPVPQREVLTLFFLNDLTLEEIALLLEVPVGTVKSRLHYARQAIRKILFQGENHARTG